MQKLVESTRIKSEGYINEINYYRNSNKWEKTDSMNPYKQVRNELIVTNGLLLRQSRIVIPKGLQKRTLDLVHKHHMGIVRCNENFRSKVWWPSRKTHKVL